VAPHWNRCLRIRDASSSVLDTLRSVVRIELERRVGSGAASSSSTGSSFSTGNLLCSPRATSAPLAFGNGNASCGEVDSKFRSSTRANVLACAIAARSAAAFGESVVEGYLKRLTQAKHPMMVFDAFFGLSAIALANPSSKAAIIAELRSLRDGNLALIGIIVYLICLESAIRILSGTEADNENFGSCIGTWKAPKAWRRAPPCSAIRPRSPRPANISILDVAVRTESRRDEHFPKSPILSGKESPEGISRWPFAVRGSPSRSVPPDCS